MCAALTRGWPRRLYRTLLPQVACGSGLELIFQFLMSDEPANRPDYLIGTPSVMVSGVRAGGQGGSCLLAEGHGRPAGSPALP